MSAKFLLSINFVLAAFQPSHSANFQPSMSAKFSVPMLCLWPSPTWLQDFRSNVAAHTRTGHKFISLAHHQSSRILSAHDTHWRAIPTMSLGPLEGQAVGTMGLLLKQDKTRQDMLWAHNPFLP